MEINFFPRCLRFNVNVFILKSEKDESVCIKSDTWEIFDLMRKADLVDYTKKIKLSSGQVEADFSTKYVHSLILAQDSQFFIKRFFLDTIKSCIKLYSKKLKVLPTRPFIFLLFLNLVILVQKHTKNRWKLASERSKMTIKHEALMGVGRDGHSQDP